jgi:uncharacterized membrane protein
MKQFIEVHSKFKPELIAISEKKTHKQQQQQTTITTNQQKIEQRDLCLKNILLVSFKILVAHVFLRNVLYKCMQNNNNNNKYNNKQEPCQHGHPTPNVFAH